MTDPGDVAHPPVRVRTPIAALPKENGERTDRPDLPHTALGLDLEARYEEIRDNQNHIKEDYKFSLVEPMLRNLRVKFPGSWADDPRYAEQIRELNSNLLFENGLRALAVQLDVWVLPHLDDVRKELDGLIANVEDALTR